VTTSLANVPRRATRAEEEAKAEAMVMEAKAKVVEVVHASSAVKKATLQEIVLRVDKKAKEKAEAKVVVVSATISVTRAAADSVMSVVSSTRLETFDQILYPVLCVFFGIVGLHT